MCAHPPTPAQPARGPAAPPPARIVILYSRGTYPDEELLHDLESRLAEEGWNVFVDRHLSVGVEWAAEVEERITGSDVLIALVSPQSIQSETLSLEVQIAAEVSRRQGRPRLVPIYVDFDGALPPVLSPLIAATPPLAWKGPESTEELLRTLTAALREGTGAPSSTASRKLEPVGGAVPLDSAFYVERDTDEAFRAAIARRDSIVLVKGARQMGKTSLLARGLQQARQAGARVILTDFQKLNEDDFDSPETLLIALGEWIADQLDLDVLPGDVWAPNHAPSVNFDLYLRREVLPELPGTVVWGMDEVDRLFGRPYSSEFFSLLRSWHYERSLDPTGPWNRFTLAIAYATEAHLFISDIHQSPFNVGTRLTLQDFTLEQVQDLNERYGSPLGSTRDLERYYRLVNGHPYLVRRGLHEMVVRELSVEQFEQQAGREDNGIFSDHLGRMLLLLGRDPEMCDAVREVLQGRPCPTLQTFYRLRSAGVIVGDLPREARLRCQLYRDYLSRHLLG